MKLVVLTPVYLVRCYMNATNSSLNIPLFKIEVGFDARAAAIQDSSRARPTGASKILGFDARSVIDDCKTNYSKAHSQGQKFFSKILR